MSSYGKDPVRQSGRALPFGYNYQKIVSLLLYCPVYLYRGQEWEFKLDDILHILKYLSGIL